MPGSDEAVNGVQDHRYDAAIITARKESSHSASRPAATWCAATSEPTRP